MATYSWILDSGDWNSGGNWSPSGGPPTSADSATISATGSNYSVAVELGRRRKLARPFERERNRQ